MIWKIYCVPVGLKNGKRILQFTNGQELTSKHCTESTFLNSKLEASASTMSSADMTADLKVSKENVSNDVNDTTYPNTQPLPDYKDSTTKAANKNMATDPGDMPRSLLSCDDFRKLPYCEQNNVIKRHLQLLQRFIPTNDYQQFIAEFKCRYGNIREEICNNQPEVSKQQLKEISSNLLFGMIKHALDGNERWEWHLCFSE